MAATSTAKKSSPAPVRMPIEDYDRLSVKAIVPHLMDLTGRQLQAVVAYEKAHKNRVTLLQAVRKLELAREALAQKAIPPSHLTMVEDAIEEAVEDISEDASKDTFDDSFDDALDDEIEDELDAFDDRFDDAFDNEVEDEVDVPVVEPIVVAAPPPAKRPAMGGVARSATSRSEARAIASEAKARAKAAKSAPDIESIDEPEADAQARPRPSVKAATWEEELRPQLPRRIESPYDLDFEPPVVALAPPTSEETHSGSVTPILRATGVTKVRKKFESVALVMAAILAILLGLAIGTVLARTGSVSAQPSAPTAVTQTANPGGG